MSNKEFPSGFPYYNREKLEFFQRLEAATKALFQANGAEQVILPCVDWLEALTAKGGGENDKLIYPIGDGTRALRFDLTVPLTRYVQQNQQLIKKNTKIFQIGPVWRADRPQKGRLREFYQADFDVVRCTGPDEDMKNIAEMFQSILKVFSINTEIQLNPVRGQDYYTGSTFELVSTENKLSVAGGGAYDMKKIGGADFKCVGGSIGMSRIVDLIYGRSD